MHLFTGRVQRLDLLKIQVKWPMEVDKSYVRYSMKPLGLSAFPLSTVELESEMKMTWYNPYEMSHCLAMELFENEFDRTH